MLPSSSELTYFLEVAETLNLSRASEKLGVTQPTLSLSIKKLEENIGIKLLIRSKSGVQLTKYGKEFRAHAKDLLFKWDQLKAKTLSSETEVKGEYSIGCHTSVALYTLPHFLPKLLKSYPDFNLKLHHDLSRKITEKVISFEIDYGLVINPVSHPDLVIHKIAKDTVSLWESPTNINGDVLIADRNLIQTRDIVSKLKKQKIEFKRVIHCEDLEVIAELVHSGTGVGILPSRVAKRQRKSKMKIFSSKSPSFDDELAFIYRFDTLSRKTSSKLLDFIKASVK